MSCSVPSNHRLSAARTVRVIGVCTLIAGCATPERDPADEPPPLTAATPEQFLTNLAGDAPLAIWVEVREARPYTINGEARTETLLSIHQVYRDTEDALGGESSIILDTPGADFGGYGVHTSRAPVFVAGMEGLIFLTTDDNFDFQPWLGNRSFLPGFEGAIDFCPANNPDEILDCPTDLPVLPIAGSPGHQILNVDQVTSALTTPLHTY